MIKYLRIRLMLSAPALLLLNLFLLLILLIGERKRNERGKGKEKLDQKFFDIFFFSVRKNWLGVAMCFICIPFLLKDNPDTSLPSWFFKTILFFHRRQVALR